MYLDLEMSGADCVFDMLCYLQVNFNTILIGPCAIRRNR